MCIVLMYTLSQLYYVLSCQFLIFINEPFFIEAIKFGSNIYFITKCKTTAVLQKKN